jgi:hypothetical protein
MFVVPVPADEFLPFAIRAIESNDYAGLLIVLARTADARKQHKELTKDWTSIHDVTGPLLAVLCPEPEALGGQAVVFNRNTSTGIAAEGLDSGTWRFDHRDWKAFEALLERFGRGGERAVRPYSARVHQEAWSEATSRCAKYFGIAESSLPSLLVLSYWERTATLIALANDTSIYALCKSVVGRLGTQSDDILHSKAAQEEAVANLNSLQHESRRWERCQRQALLPDAEWQEQLASLDRHVSMLDDMFPDLVATSRSSLGPSHRRRSCRLKRLRRFESPRCGHERPRLPPDGYTESTNSPEDLEGRAQARGW